MRLRKTLKVQIIFVMFFVLCHTSYGDEVHENGDFEFPGGVTDTDGVIFGDNNASTKLTTGSTPKNSASNVKVTVTSNAILACCIGWKITKNYF